MEVTISEQTSSNEGAQSDKNVQNRTASSGQESTNNVKKGSLERGKPNEGPNFVNNFCQAQKGGRQISSNYKPKKVKPVFALFTFRDGRSEKCKKDLLNQGDYMIKIDLRGAYYLIPIHEESQK